MRRRWAWASSHRMQARAKMRKCAICCGLWLALFPFSIGELGESLAEVGEVAGLRRDGGLDIGQRFMTWGRHDRLSVWV